MHHFINHLQVWLLGFEIHFQLLMSKLLVELPHLKLLALIRRHGLLAAVRQLGLGPFLIYTLEVLRHLAFLLIQITLWNLIWLQNFKKCLLIWAEEGHLLIQLIWVNIEVDVIVVNDGGWGWHNWRNLSQMTLIRDARVALVWLSRFLSELIIGQVWKLVKEWVLVTLALRWWYNVLCPLSCRGLICSSSVLCAYLPMRLWAAHLIYLLDWDCLKMSLLL